MFPYSSLGVSFKFPTGPGTVPLMFPSSSFFVPRHAPTQSA